MCKRFCVLFILLCLYYQLLCSHAISSFILFRVAWSVPERPWAYHHNDIIMGAIASQITSLTIVYSTVYSDADQRKHESSASLAFVRGFHRGPVNSPHKWPVTRKMFPFDDVIMSCWYILRHDYVHEYRPVSKCIAIYLSSDSYVMNYFHTDKLMQIWFIWIALQSPCAHAVVVGLFRIPWLCLVSSKNYHCWRCHGSAWCWASGIIGLLFLCTNVLPCFSFCSKMPKIYH